MRFLGSCHTSLRSFLNPVDSFLYFLFCNSLDHLVVEVSSSHTQTRAPGRTPLNELSARPAGRYPHKTQQTLETNIHVLSGIRTHDPSSGLTPTPDVALPLVSAFLSVMSKYFPQHPALVQFTVFDTDARIGGFSSTTRSGL